MRRGEMIFRLGPLLSKALCTRTRMRIAALASAAILLAGCSKAPEADPRTGPPTILTARAAPAAESMRRFSGVVAARVQSNLGYRVNGKLVGRLVDVGQ